MLATVDISALTAVGDFFLITVRALLDVSFSVAFLVGVLVGAETFGLRLAFSFPSVSSACVVVLCHPALVCFLCASTTLFLVLPWPSFDLVLIEQRYAD